MSVLLNRYRTYIAPPDGEERFELMDTPNDRYGWPTSPENIFYRATEVDAVIASLEAQIIGGTPADVMEHSTVLWNVLDWIHDCDLGHEFVEWVHNQQFDDIAKLCIPMITDNHPGDLEPRTRPNRRMDLEDEVALLKAQLAEAQMAALTVRKEFDDYIENSRYDGMGEDL